MRILFDNGTPRGLARFLGGHTVVEARVRGWEDLENGDLIAAAEAADFELLVTTDKNIQYQQDLTGRKLAIVVLEHSHSVAAAVDAAIPGSYFEVEVPFQD